MDNELIKIFSEELRETKKLVAETMRMADAATKQADAAMSKADAAWELVVITRNQVQEEISHLKLPWWKKVFGTGNNS